jgi:hypothetical protein
MSGGNYLTGPQGPSSENTLVEAMPIDAGQHDQGGLSEHLFALSGLPAYARRAIQVQDASEELIASCRQERNRLLTMVRLRLGRLHALAGGFDTLRPWLWNEESRLVLQSLHKLLEPRLRISIGPSGSSWLLRQALCELKKSVDRFNRHWQEYLEGLDLSRINALREGYNRYYTFEKECAVGSPRLARQGFEPLPPLRSEDIAALLPCLPSPELH